MLEIQVKSGIICVFFFLYFSYIILCLYTQSFVRVIFWCLIKKTLKYIFTGSKIPVSHMFVFTYASTSTKYMTRSGSKWETYVYMWCVTKCVESHQQTSTGTTQIQYWHSHLSIMGKLMNVMTTDNWTNTIFVSNHKRRIRDMYFLETTHTHTHIYEKTIRKSLWSKYISPLYPFQRLFLILLWILDVYLLN